MKNVIKGFIIGVGKIIPGLSGALLAISMGVYDKSIYYLNNFKKNKKASINYLLPLGIGIIIAIIFFSKIINTLLDKYYLYTMLFFSGLIIGTLPSLTKNISKKHYYITSIALLIFTIISFVGIKENNYLIKNNLFDMLVFFISGLIEAIGTVIPGLSSSAMLMNLGTYKLIVYSLGNIFNINNYKVLIPFGTGIIIGIISLIKIIGKVLEKRLSIISSVILGILMSNIIKMMHLAIKTSTSLKEVLAGIIFMILGIYLSSIFEKKKTL